MTREYSPEHTIFDNSVLPEAINGGAAKVSSLISIEEAKRLDEIKYAKPDREQVFDLAPSLEAIVGKVATADNLALGMKIQFGTYSPTTLNEGYTRPAHTDPKNLSPIGLSLLLPVRGWPGYFAADEEDFMLFDAYSKKNDPDYFWEYGVGDGIFMRQKITYVNGKRLPLGGYDQMHHTGASSTPRRLLIVDFLTRMIEVPDMPIKSRKAGLLGLIKAS